MLFILFCACRKEKLSHDTEKLLVGNWREMNDSVPVFFIHEHGQLQWFDSTGKLTVDGYIANLRELKREDYVAHAQAPQVKHYFKVKFRPKLKSTGIGRLGEYTRILYYSGEFDSLGNFNGVPKIMIRVEDSDDVLVFVKA